MQIFWIYVIFVLQGWVNSGLLVFFGEKPLNKQNIHPPKKNSDGLSQSMIADIFIQSPNYI